MNYNELRFWLLCVEQLVNTTISYIFITSLSGLDKQVIQKNYLKLPFCSISKGPSVNTIDQDRIRTKINPIEIKRYQSRLEILCEHKSISESSF